MPPRFMSVNEAAYQLIAIFHLKKIRYMGQTNLGQWQQFC